MPLAPAVTVIHDDWLAAVHAQPLTVVIPTVADAAVAPSVALTGDSAKVHVRPCWVTVRVRPAIVSVPDRWLVPGLAATE